MGAELILDFLVIKENKEPDFNATRDAYDALTPEEIDTAMITEGYADKTDPHDQEFWLDLRQEFMEEVKNAIDIIEQGYSDRRDFSWLLVKGWWVLVSGEMSWGDEPEGAKAIRLFRCFDLHQKAGFES